MVEQPWIDEPCGPEFAYMTRVSRADNTSWDGFVWPKSGYVQCHKWEGDEPVSSFMGNFARSGGGLWGFIDGLGFYRYGLSMYRDPVRQCSIQLCVVSRSEARTQRSETRVPRAWVKCSGSLSEVEDSLWKEGTPYSLQVCRNLLTGYKAGLGPGTLREGYEMIFGRAPQW